MKKLKRFILTGSILMFGASFTSAAESQKVFDFSKGPGNWKISNYESRVSFAATNINGVSGFAAYVPGVKVPIPKGKRPKHPDTAWGMKGPQIEVAPGSGFAFTVDFFTKLDASKKSGADEHSCFILFYGEDGMELPDYVPFALGPESNVWQSVTFYGRVPEKAKSLRLHIGCDMPNIGPGDAIVFSKAAFSWYPYGPSPEGRVSFREDGGVLVGGK
ncbi:MAG: hypothetical protein J6W10_02555, partial [Kiritimatiellae bacterium]|nr:hypothetical protein [Kiritimatiellia bacterium]